MEETIYVYKVPDEQTAIYLRNVVGLNGNFLNPIQDNNNNWIISQQEWINPEFQFLKEQYPEKVSLFELIIYEPIPPTPLF